MGPIHSRENHGPSEDRRNTDEESEMRRITTLLWVTGLAAVALLGSRLISARKRKAEPQSEEYWYPYMQA